MNKKNDGLSLIELCVVLAFLSITISIAIPNFRNWIAKHQTQVETQAVLTHLQFARLAAIHFNSHVTVCGSKSQQACDGDFHQGMLIFLDRYASGDIADDDALLRVADPMKHGSISWNRQRNVIQFAPDGSLKSQNGTLTYQHKNKTAQRNIVLSRTGRVRIG